MSEQQTSRSWWVIAIVVILGLTVGLALGLIFGWVIMPVEFVDTGIAELDADSKEDYILLVASSYVCDGDLEKAQARLDMLEAPNVNQWISDMVDRYINEGRDEGEIRALVALAHGLGVDNPQMYAYLASPTPRPTDTPLPTNTPLPTATPLPTDVPTLTPVAPTEAPPTDTTVPPTNTPPPIPTNTPVPPTDAPLPTATNTPAPPTNTPAPPTNTSAPPTNTPKPQPTNTPQPTNAPAAGWSIIEQRLVGPGQDGQGCDYGNLQIRVTVVGAGGQQLNGVWVYDKYSQVYQVTGNVDSADWGPGETKFEYGIGGGGSLCIAAGEGGGCVSGWSRDMPVYYLPPFEDLWAAGYCQCEKPDISREECQRLVNEGKLLGTGAGHFSWRIVFKRN